MMTKMLKWVKRSQRAVITSRISLHFATERPLPGVLDSRPATIDSITEGWVANYSWTLRSVSESREWQSVISGRCWNVVFTVTTGRQLKLQTPREFIPLIVSLKCTG